MDATITKGETTMTIEQGRNGEIRVITKKSNLYAEIEKELQYYNKYYFKINFVAGYPHVIGDIRKYQHKIVFTLASEGPLQALRKELVRMDNVEAAQIFYK